MSKKESKEIAQIMKDRNDKSETVKVVIRCRPMSEKEMNANHEVCVRINDKTGEIWVSKP